MCGIDEKMCAAALTRKNAMHYSLMPRQLLQAVMQSSPLAESLGESDNSSNAKQSGVKDDTRGGILLGAGSTAAAGSASASVLIRILIEARAGEGALNLAGTALLGRSKLLELIARLLDVRGTRDVKGTLDVLKGREFSTEIC